MVNRTDACFIETGIVPHALYAMLGYFTEYKLMNKEIIQRHRDEKSGEKVIDKKYE